MNRRTDANHCKTNTKTMRTHSNAQNNAHTMRTQSRACGRKQCRACGRNKCWAGGQAGGTRRENARLSWASVLPQTMMVFLLQCVLEVCQISEMGATKSLCLQCVHFYCA